MTTPILRPGVHTWVWPCPSHDAFAHMCADYKAKGFTGVIVQDGVGTDEWARGRKGPPDTRGRAARIAKDAGLQFTLGLGMDGNWGWKHNLRIVSDSILACIELSGNCMLNWEGQWGNEPEDKDRANKVVDQVLAQNPHADRACMDAPWWAPSHLYKRINGRPKRFTTHPMAPTREFGRLCKGQRAPQVYGANIPGSPDGTSARMLWWARHESQYPAMGTPATSIIPATQCYERSVTDQVNMLTAEPTMCMWLARKANLEFKLAMAYVQALKLRGFEGPGASERFQTAAGIAGPTLVGRRALAAAGVEVPEGADSPKLWSRPLRPLPGSTL